MVERYSNNGKEKYRWIFHSERVTLHGGCNYCKHLKLESLDGRKEFKIDYIKFSSRSMEVGYRELERIRQELRRWFVKRLNKKS